MILTGNITQKNIPPRRLLIAPEKIRDATTVHYWITESFKNHFSIKKGTKEKKMALIRFCSLAACLMLIVAICGCNDNEENQFPVASLSAAPLSGQTPLTVHFQGTGVDPDGENVTFQWDFDDGSTSDVSAPSHVFTEPGLYNTTLFVHDTRGGEDHKSLSIWVWEKEPIRMTYQEVILDAVLSFDNETKDWWSDFGHLEEGDTVIIHDTLSNVTYIQEEDRTELVFVSQTDNVLALNVQGNQSGFLEIGDTLEVFVHVVWVSYLYEFWEGEIWTIHVETFQELWDNETNSPCALPPENIHIIAF